MSKYTDWYNSIPKDFFEEIGEAEHLGVALNKYVRLELEQQFDFIGTVGMFTSKGNIYFAVYEGNKTLKNPEVFEEMRQKDDTLVKYVQTTVSFHDVNPQRPFYKQLLELNEQNKDTLIRYHETSYRKFEDLPNYKIIAGDPQQS